MAASHGLPFEEKAPVFESGNIEIGAKIVGLTDYVRITCHAVGNTPAIQAFEGQGPNLKLSGRRFRLGYFQSWMHWPQRFVSATIMPEYTSDKRTGLNAAFYDANSEKQFEAVWQWMNSLERHWGSQLVV